MSEAGFEVVYAGGIGVMKKLSKGSSKAFEVVCPTCFADPGELCWSATLGCELPEHHVHAERVEAARKPRSRRAA
jgi:hypothetical protein